jgi:hypothetical protein
MAENEALDLSSPHARQWKPILEAALAGDPLEKTSRYARKALLDLINKAMKSFAKRGLLRTIRLPASTLWTFDCRSFALRYSMTWS